MNHPHSPSSRFGATLAAMTVFAMAIGTALPGCRSTLPNDNLAKARSDLEQTRSDPVVMRNAPLELEKADLAMRRAEAAWADKGDTAQTSHLAYLAQQRAAIARNVAALKQTEERLEGVGAERERLRAEAAMAAATSAQQQVSSAQRQVSIAEQQASMARQRAVSEGERAAALQRELENMQAKKTERGMVVTLSDVLFASGRSTLQPGAQRTADQLASLLQQYPERRLLVEGFTDNVGKPEMNMALSERRAESLRNALIERGIPANRIDVRGYGEGYPIADNKTPAGRTQNRRVEILFSDAQGSFMPRY